MAPSSPGCGASNKPGVIQLESCVAICRSCGDECERHAHMPHCQVCAEACRRCDHVCQELLAALK
jgi:hypothetical protein